MPLTATPSINYTTNSMALSGLVDRLKRALQIDFDDVNERLQDCVATAKEEIERYTGCLLSPGTVSVSWATFYDYEDLPFGPVRGAVTAKTLGGSAVALGPAQFAATPFPRLNADFPAGIALSYEAGYDLMSDSAGSLPLPDGLMEAVVQYAANLYDYGDRNWRLLASRYKRWGWGS